MMVNAVDKSKKKYVLMGIFILMTGCKTESQNNDSMVGYTQELAKKQSELSAKTYIDQNSDNFKQIKIDDSSAPASSNVVDLNLEKKKN